MEPRIIYNIGGNERGSQKVHTSEFKNVHV